MERLMSMVDFVIYINSKEHSLNTLIKIRKYANFLSQKLELWMFVPCKLVEGVWVKLSEPKEYKNWLEIQKHGGYSLCHNSNEYQKALDRILFKGIEFADIQPSTEYNYYHVNGAKIFEANNQYNFFPVYSLKTIESVCKHNLELTASAKKTLSI